MLWKSNIFQCFRCFVIALKHNFLNFFVEYIYESIVMRNHPCAFVSSPGPGILKLYSCLNQLSPKFIMLINVEMPIIVGISIFTSMMNTTSERPKARNFFICLYFSFFEKLSWVEHENSSITSGPEHEVLRCFRFASFSVVICPLFVVEFF